MTNSKKPLPIFIAVSTSVAALGDFVALILDLRPSTGREELYIILLGEVLLIALSIYQWVLYFRGYIDQQIDRRLQDAGHGRAQFD